MKDDRFIAFDGCLNCRDLGGYPTCNGRKVRSNRLYRSDSLHWMSSDDAHKAVNDMHITQVLDLRSTDEKDRFGKGSVTDHSIQYLHLPVAESLDYKKLLGTSPIYTGLRIPYIHILKHGKEQITAAITVMAQSDGYPAIFFCSAGMDRTGILAAVVLSLLGVSDEDIINDYMLTNEHMPEMIARWRTIPFYDWIFTIYPEDIFFVRREMMQVFLEDARREYGTMVDYALRCGISNKLLSELENNFLEKEAK